MWSISLRNAVFSTTMVEYLKNGTLLTLPEVGDVLGSTLVSKPLPTVELTQLSCE